METIAQMHAMNGTEGHEDLFLHRTQRHLYRDYEVENARLDMTPRQLAKFNKELVPVRKVWTWKLVLIRGNHTLVHSDERLINPATGEEVE